MNSWILCVNNLWDSRPWPSNWSLGDVFVCLVSIAGDVKVSEKTTFWKDTAAVGCTKSMNDDIFFWRL